MKNILRLFIINAAFIILNSAFSFGQEIEWQNTIGGDSTDRLSSIQQTSDGGYILGGWSLSNVSVDKTENSNGFSDCWMVKTDSMGIIQWQNTIGGSGYDGISSIRQTVDGGYILGGWSSSNISGDKTENMVGGVDYWIVKTDSIGNIQWQNTIGGGGSDELTCLEQTSNGGYILGGWSNSNMSGDKTEFNIGSWDYWVVKTDSIGNIVWDITLGGTAQDILLSIAQASDGGCLIGGRSNSGISGNKTVTSNGFDDYWIIKLDSNGTIQWQKSIGGNGFDIIGSIQQTTDDGYILGGWSNSNISGDKIENCNGVNDYWIVKIDAIGNIQWQNTIGGFDSDNPHSIQQTADGGYIIGGSSSSNISGDKMENGMSNADYWLVKTDSTGNIQWQNTIGGGNSDDLLSVMQTTAGDYILGGSSLSNTSGDKTENCIGLEDYWIVKITNKYNSITGINYADLNSSNTKDANEPALTQQKITEQTTGRFTFTDQNGNYSVSVLDSGNFTVAPPPTGINYYTPVPTTHTATFNGINQIDSLNDFALQPTGVFNDLCITITPTGPFRSGFNASYVINYQNVGTTSIAGDVIFFPYSNVTYVSSNVTPTSVSLDSVIWNTGVLAPFQGGSIVVTVAVNVGLPIGTLINSAVRIEPVANDANPGCNYHSWEVYTIGSYDPNDILVSEDTLFTTQLPSTPWLDYTIRFQNTGNDTAFAVKVLNPIDTNFLNLSSIEFVNSSHPVNLNYIPWERNMQFTFNNILLPDSNINEPLSHGFVHYRIKPKTTLQSGDSILNNAFIYFDFNAPVATNTVATHIVLPTAIKQVAAGSKQLLVFPNPAANEITISGYPLAKGASTTLKIIDVMGKEVYTASITTSNFKLQTLNFPAGVYFVQVGGGNTISRARFIKQ